jgi:hypothetical protein
MGIPAQRQASHRTAQANKLGRSKQRPPEMAGGAALMDCKSDTEEALHGQDSR